MVEDGKIIFLYSFEYVKKMNLTFVDGCVNFGVPERFDELFVVQENAIKKYIVDEIGFKSMFQIEGKLIGELCNLISLSLKSKFAEKEVFLASEEFSKYSCFQNQVEFSTFNIDSELIRKAMNYYYLPLTNEELKIYGVLFVREGKSYFKYISPKEIEEVKINLFLANSVVTSLPVVEVVRSVN